jgi:hypothetical protein
MAITLGTCFMSSEGHWPGGPHGERDGRVPAEGDEQTDDNSPIRQHHAFAPASSDLGSIYAVLPTGVPRAPPNTVATASALTSVDRPSSLAQPAPTPTTIDIDDTRQWTNTRLTPSNVPDLTTFGVSPSAAPQGMHNTSPTEEIGTVMHSSSPMGSTPLSMQGFNPFDILNQSLGHSFRHSLNVHRPYHPEEPEMQQSAAVSSPLSLPRTRLRSDAEPPTSQTGPKRLTLGVEAPDSFKKRASRTQILQSTRASELEIPESDPADAESGGSDESATRIARLKAHRAYTQKSREKVNVRFNALMEALPPPPPRVNPRSKAEILQYSVQQVLFLRQRNTQLEMRLALTSEAELSQWIHEKTKDATTIREVTQPILELFCVGLGWEACDVWAIDARAPRDRPALGQAWTFIPPQMNMDSDQDQIKAASLEAFLMSGRAMYFTITDTEAISTSYATGSPMWLDCRNPSIRYGRHAASATCERSRLATQHGISDMLIVPLQLYNQVQIVAAFYTTNRQRNSSASVDAFDPASIVRKTETVIALLAKKFTLAGPS